MRLLLVAVEVGDEVADIGGPSIVVGTVVDVQDRSLKSKGCLLSQSRCSRPESLTMMPATMI